MSTTGRARCSSLGIAAGLLLVAAGCQPGPAPLPAAPKAVVGTAVPKATEPAAKAVPQKPTTPERVAFGHVPPFAVPVYVAMEKGYFGEQGIEVALVPFQAGPAMIPPLATNEIQVAAQAPTPGLFNGIARGINMRIVGDMVRLDPTGEDNWLVVRTQDAESIKQIADLKGKKPGLQAVPGTQVIQLERVLKSAGLGLDDVNYEAIAFADMVPALTSGAIQGAIASGSFLRLALERNIAVKLVNMGGHNPDMEVAVIVNSEAFATQRTETGKRWMAAYHKGLREVQEARNTGANRDALAAIVARIGNVPPQQVELQYADRDGRANMESVVYDLNWYRDHGHLEGPALDVSKLGDNQFIEFALQVAK